MPSTAKRQFCCDEELARIGYDGLNADEDLEAWRSGRLPVSINIDAAGNPSASLGAGAGEGWFGE